MSREDTDRDEGVAMTAIPERQYDDRDGVYAVLFEARNQGPILMETEGCDSSFDAARRRLVRQFGGSVLRAAVVRLTYVEGNELLLLDMKRMQK